MANALENFFNWQSDQDWWWGPLLFLRPPKNVRMTLLLWLKMIGIGVLATAPVGAIIGSLLAYYDYTAAKHHETKIPPVIVTKNWITRSSPQAFLSCCALLIAVSIAGCVCQHWAWNRRADRLNRQPVLPKPVSAEMPGVWPPPPRTVCFSTWSETEWSEMPVLLSGKLSGMWERFFNWQSDMDWTWGPFLPLRPARPETIQPWVWVRLFIGLSGMGTLLVMVFVSVCIGGPKMAARQHWRLPPGITETLGTLAAMGSDPSSMVLLIGVMLCLPLLFFAFCLPFHLAWNRRARRLATAQEKAAADIWPPAPRPH